MAGQKGAGVTEAVANVLKAMDPKPDYLETALAWIEVINVTRKQRNLVAHFAGKRHPKKDVYVFVSKSEKDAINVLGIGLGEHEVHTSGGAISRRWWSRRRTNLESWSFR